MQLQELLERYRVSSTSEREKGDYFEKLVRIFLEHDDTQKQFYSAVVAFSDWAKEQGWSNTDIGIDLVATLADGTGYAAIQCKFYAPNHAIQKTDIDSFISASSNDCFSRLIIADTTQKDFSRNTKETLDNLSKDWHRIGLNDLEESRIDWSQFVRTGQVSMAPKKKLRDHQRDALKAVTSGLQKDDRGKLIMACGTGKTFTSLRIAEAMAGPGKRVLFMVPSLALMSQTVREWKNDAKEDFTAFAACSDKRVGRKTDADSLDLNVHDLAFPATTDAERLAHQVNEATRQQMTVVFSTYHSIDVLTRAQENHGMPEFDLVVCDEAHRTTGVTLKDEDDSNFVRIHSNEYVAARKRLYMTATPRIFGDAARRKADDHDAELASMDDESKFGKDLFHRGFGWAVERELLTDYKVVVLAVDEGLISSTIQGRLKQGAELTLDDATKIIGCYKALTKSDIKDELSVDPKPMKRALAFCQSIARSKIIEEEFSKVVEEYTSSDQTEDMRHLKTEVRHIDGSFNASAREEMLNWLKGDSEVDSCRILTNAKVLSEGVDVPALDAIMFMHPRKSQIDVVQSVGRVMRRDPSGEKKLGYVILPVAIPPNTKPEVALNDNERYQVVWQILNALRSHDERLDARINQAELGEDISDKVDFVRISSESELKELTAVVKDISTSKSKSVDGKGAGIGNDVSESQAPVEPMTQGKLELDEFTRAIIAKIVQKCGTREYWDTWAKDIAKIAQTHITRITTIVGQTGPERNAFLAFLEELQDDLNPSITEAEAIEMLAQHLITRPVFDALFKGSQFTKANPVSRAMETVLGQLHEHNLAKESESLAKFYASVERRAADVVTAHGRQELVYKLYDSFFKGAFPMLTQRLGIVYTPVEVVDFIIHSVNDILQDQFGQTLGSKGVHILDPFTGTATFITRLLQSGLIAPDELSRKYREEIHANEIVLLAYYIAAINIETVYHELMQGRLSEGAAYEPFRGMLLTDTFQMYEQERDMVANLLPDNSERRTRQKALDIRVIIGNPPYSAGQGSANDNAANIAYPSLDAAIRDSYAAHSSATNKNALYDSYIRAIRWASDRIGDAGVMAYVTNAGWVEGNATDGLRKCLVEEFSNIYVFHLRGNQRTSGELSRKEGGKIFGSGSRAPIAISVLVKNPDASDQGRIYFHDIGDYLDQKQKLAIIREFGSINGIERASSWRRIIPDENNDWLNQVDRSFERFIHIGDKSLSEGKKIFSLRSRGLETSRDAWAYNASKRRISKNIKRSIQHYNKLREKNKDAEIDTRSISWTRGLKKRFRNREEISYEDGQVVPAIYRPFEKSHVYFGRAFNEYVNQMPRIFPYAGADNLAIAVTGKGASGGFSAYMVNVLPDLNMLAAGAQCFPLYLYEAAGRNGKMFDEPGEDSGELSRRMAITDGGLAHFQEVYPKQEVAKEDLFYYVYGLLHSPEYRKRFKNNLTKALPRIPPVRTFKDFAAFRDAGRALSDLHVNFEAVQPYMVTFKEGDHRLINEAQEDPVTFYRVKKMKFGGKGKEKDKTTVIYNDNITMQNIPVAAYDYVVNGKPALEWVMERQVVKKDRASGIVNDANDYANETVGDPRYPLDLFCRVITVSLETINIVRSLPPLEIDS